MSNLKQFLQPTTAFVTSNGLTLVWLGPEEEKPLTFNDIL